MPNMLSITGVAYIRTRHCGYPATSGHPAGTLETMEVGLQARVAGSGGWSVPIGGRRRGADAPRAEVRRGDGPGRGGVWTGLWSPSGWLLVEFPTALLLAVFVGTGWLGYAQHGEPTRDAPIPAVVVPGLGAATPTAGDAAPAAGPDVTGTR